TSVRPRWGRSAAPSGTPAIRGCSPRTCSGWAGPSTWHGWWRSSGHRRPPPASLPHRRPRPRTGRRPATVSPTPRNAGLTVGVVPSDAQIQVVAEPDARVPFPTSKPLLGEGNRECGRGFFGFPPDQPMVRRRIARAASGGGWLAAAGDGRHLINRRGARAAPTGVGAARTRRV